MESLLLENPRRRSRRSRRSSKRKTRSRRHRRNPVTVGRRRRGGRRSSAGGSRTQIMAAVQQGATIAGSFWLSSFVSNYLRGKFPALSNYSSALVQAALGAGLVAARRYLPGGLGKYAPALGAGMIGSGLIDFLRNSDTLSPDVVAGRIVYGYPTTGYAARAGRGSNLAADTMLFQDGDLLAPPELLGLGYDDEGMTMSGMTSFGGEA